MKHILYLLTALLLFCTTTLAQDSARTVTRFQIGAQFWARHQFGSYNVQVTMPAYTRASRIYHTKLPIRHDSITDNPLLHGATYVVFKTKTSWHNKVELLTDLYAEHRGVSYGVFDRSNTLVYPVMQLKAKDTFRILSQSLAASARIGQFLDEQLDEGLMIYNLDLQGIQVEGKVKSWIFQYNLYGDLDNSIGLNIDDLQAFALKKTLSHTTDYIGLSWVIARPAYHILRGNYSLNLSARKTLEDWTLYAQYGFRPVRHNPLTEKGWKDQSGVVAGVQFQKDYRRLRLTAKAEGRFYGHTFNQPYDQGYGLRYRDSAQNFYEMYANTTGKYIYPLRKFETPFSQWAVFTEFAGFNLGAFTLLGDLSYSLSSKLHTGLHYDLTYITGSLDKMWADPDNRHVAFLYPFFEASLNYTPAPNIKGSIHLSNKAMNLDVHYPTHYLLRKPQLGLRVYASF